MPAWDNVQLAGPPNGPAYINSAMNAAQTLGNLVNNGFNAYRQGQDWQYQQAQRNFFQDPNNQQLLSQFMQQPNQQNYGSLMQKMAQVGGLQTAGPLIDQYLGISQDQAIANRIGSGNGQPNPTAPQAGNPPQITGKSNSPQSSPYNTREQVLNNTGDNTGGSSIDQLAAERHINLHDFLAARPQFVQFVGNDNLNPRQVSGVTAAMDKYAGSGTANPVQPSGTDEQETGKATAGSAVQGGPPISPAPTSGGGKIRSSAPPPSAIAGDGLEEARNKRTAQAQGTRPTPLGDMAKVDALNARIQRLRADAAAYARRSPGAAQQADKAADDLVKERDRILESISKFNEPGRETRDIESGATALKIGMEKEAQRRLKIEEGNITEGRKNLTSIDKTGDDYRISNQKVQLAKSLLMHPDFYSGPAEGINRSFKQWTATLGGDPNKGTPQEAFQKTVSDLLSEQIRTMAASGVGRVLLSEVQQMQKGIASLGVTPASNRLLLEEVDRVQQAHIQIQNLAHEYLLTHEYLDPAFNKQVSNYFTQHPLFSQSELRNPTTIAPARMPARIAGVDQETKKLLHPVEVKKWARDNGLKAGDVFTGEDGNGRFKLRLE